jgi:hypothetical protein
MGVAAHLGIMLVNVIGKWAAIITKQLLSHLILTCLI